MASSRVLITGGSGFVGQWLCRHLAAAGHTVFAGSVGQPTGPDILTRDERAAITWLTLDTTSDEQVARALDQSAPDRIVHLAAMAFSLDATTSPAKAFDVNALGVLRLISKVERSRARVRMLVIGSSEQYGANADRPEPLKETVPLAPLTMYAASKASQELIALQAAHGGQDIVCTRSFTHSGFGHGPQYLLPSLVERAKSLPIGGALRMGNATPIRDYSHIADVVTAYAALLDNGTAGEVYNVCSGTGMTVREIAERILARLGVTAEISIDAALTRRVDLPMLLGDNSKLRAATGWTPRFTVDDIIDDLIHGTTR